MSTTSSPTEVIPLLDDLKAVVTAASLGLPDLNLVSVSPEKTGNYIALKEPIFQTVRDKFEVEHTKVDQQ